MNLPPLQLPLTVAAQTAVPAMGPLDYAIDFVYLVAAVCFIVGLKRLSSPATARSGNMVAAVGMALALLANLIGREQYWTIIIGVVIGTVIGTWMARAVKMTAMPQMVAFFNGMGGGAAAVVAIAEFYNRYTLGPSTANALTAGDVLTVVLDVVIGGVSLSGSMIAFGKLQGLVAGRAFRYAGQQLVNVGLAAAIVIIAVILLLGTYNPALFALYILLALALGVAIVMPIGGADMPVVISLLNSFTGLAAAITGFLLHNNLLIISGALVGASGTLLTQLMSKAMNRSLNNVLFGAFGAAPAGAGPSGDGTGPAGEGAVTEISPEDAAILLAYARQVIVVPGYGLAVAQAQNNVRELADQLEARGVEVKYAIHPVAGRMPGHMNVLLAEANVPYDHLYEMDDINPEFSHTDVALVIGANDVTNPAAKNTPSSPIYGMPILEVENANNIIVMKRSMRPGFAGIDNDLYLDPKCKMLFGDAKDSLQKLISELKNV